MAEFLANSVETDDIDGKEDRDRDARKKICKLSGIFGGAKHDVKKQTQNFILDQIERRDDQQCRGPHHPRQP
jgi:hypothetical protein